MIIFILKTIFFLVIWFYLFVISSMSTDDCEDKCFPFQWVISNIIFYFYPFILSISILGALISYFIGQNDLVNNFLNFGSFWLFPFTPLIFLLVMGLFGKKK
nr:hypothetical protein [Candidatus Gracilibacteria bacterium]